MLPVFDLLPFVLLENAIKYARDKDGVVVEFEEKDACLEISVKSIGPLVEADELPKLGKERFRSRNAEAVDSTGTGRGLLSAAEIATLHDIEMSFSSGPQVKILNGVPFSEFESKLIIPKARASGVV
jgi:signal transduction histidine kinase